VALSAAVSALSFISARKVELSVKLPSKHIQIARSYSSPPTFCSKASLTRDVHRYLVYNLRKRGGDSADKYFKSTELVAGVKDMRFQALMPDVLHWLGITKIHNMVSMSDMKYNAIVQSGIPILKRYDIPGAWTSMSLGSGHASDAHRDRASHPPRLAR
jgi:hypothetical protein